MQNFAMAESNQNYNNVQSNYFKFYTTRGTFWAASLEPNMEKFFLKKIILGLFFDLINIYSYQSIDIMD